MTDVLERLRTALADRYRIERELGSGGMATVYLAQDIKHDRMVAVKVLRPELAAVVGAERFLREITIAARLQHPHILPLHDSGEAGGFLHYVMPYVEGESLRDRLAREGELPIPDVVRVLRDVVDALAAAHRQGVVHRDIKPDNILRSGSHAIVTDFGVGKAVSEAAVGHEMTSDGVAVGTPAYMAPEQGAADPHVDHRADIYAVGVVAYEMLTGRTPFTGRDGHGILLAHLTERPAPVTDYRDTVPLALAKLVMRCLEKKPADRWQSAEDLLARIESIVTPETGTQPALVSVAPSRKKKLVVVVAAVAAAGLLAALVVGRDSGEVIAEASTIAITPFSPTVPDTALSRLGRDLVVTLSTNLEGVGSIRTVDARTVLAHMDDPQASSTVEEAAALARQLGASSVVHGSLIRLGSNVRLDFGLFATDGDELVARSSVTAPPENIMALTDSATWAVLREVWRGGDAPTPSIAAITTRSILALRSYLEGEAAYRAYAMDSAAEAFSQAMDADPAFWLAYRRYWDARTWNSRPVDSSVVAAFQDHRSELPERVRLHIEADMTTSLSDRMARLQELTQRFPDYWPAWMDYGDWIYHWGGMAGYTTADAVAAFERTVALNPALVPVFNHMQALYQFRRDTVGLQRVIDATSVDFPTSAARAALALEWLRGDDAAVQRLADSIAQVVARDHTTRDTLVAANTAFQGLPQAQLLLNREVLDRIVSPTRAPTYQLGTAIAWAARGAWDSAMAAADLFAVTAGNRNYGAIDRFRLAVMGSWLGALDPAIPLEWRGPAIQGARRLGAAAGAEVAWLDGIFATTQGDLEAVRAAQREVEASGSEFSLWLGRSLDAFSAQLAGKRSDAAGAMASLEREIAESLALPEAPSRRFLRREHPFLTSLNRFAAVDWLIEVGDTTEATWLLTWPESRWEPEIGRMADAALAGLAFLQRGRIEEARGNSEFAMRSFEEFLARYDMPVEAHRHLVDEAQAALARLSGMRDSPTGR
jgi:TolB-like protein